MTRLFPILPVLLLAAGCAADAGDAATKPPPHADLKPVKILDAKTDTVGAPIRYPSGKPHVTSYLLTMVPGQSTGWHRHDVPLYARILQGTLDVDYGQGVVHTYRAGDTLMEAMDRDHNGTVIGGEEVKLLIVFMGAEGSLNTVMRK